MDGLLLALQAVQVAFLWLHDWLPLGRLNDVEALRRTDPRGRRIRTTLIQAVPWTIGFVASLIFTLDNRAWPLWLVLYLWISYWLLFLGELTAWWVPYLVQPDPVRAARYRTMFGRTHSFLPERNGIVPNTLHAALHAATLATLGALVACTL